MLLNEIPSMVNQPRDQYYQGTKVLKLQIENLQNLYDSLNDKSFDFEPIIDRATKPALMQFKDFRYYPLIALLFGLFLSSIFVLIRKSFIERLK